MGLSASQARLLSITQRLSNNELASEIIAQNKLALAGANTIARDKYIQALDATKLDYVSFNTDGLQTSVSLTFNAMNAYDPLKNQYSIRNSNGQIMVSSKDAQNFANSSDLHSFLEKYGLFEQSEAEFALEDANYNNDLAKYQEDLKAFEASQTNYANNLKQYAKFTNHPTETFTRTSPYATYTTISYTGADADWIKFFQDNNAYREEQLKDFITGSTWQTYITAYSDYAAESAAYVELTGAANPYQLFTDIVGTSDNPNSCYANALNNPSGGCYAHVISCLIEDDTHTTSLGTSVVNSASLRSGSSLRSDGKDTTLIENVRPAIYKKFTSGSKAGEYIAKCDGTDVLGSNSGYVTNMLEKAYNGGDSLEIEKWTLMSDYIRVQAKNEDGSLKTDDEGNPVYTYEVKSVHQKAIDLLALLQNPSAYGVTGEELKASLINFTDGDMKLKPAEEPKEPNMPAFIYQNLPAPDFDVPAPTAPKKPEEVDKIYDRPLAQWYINLWYAMEGKDVSEVLGTVYDEQAEFSHYTITNVDKQSTNLSNFYKVIDDKLASSTDWMKYALTNGLVTIKQAALRTNGDITWKGVEWTSTSDMSEVEDSVRIAKAEAEYTNSLKDIEAQDKAYDIKIKKLDTEHQELKQELDSIKNVMGKNVERSFTAFS